MWRLFLRHYNVYFMFGKESMSDANSASIPSWRWLTVVLVPFVIASVYLWLSRWPTRWFTGSSDCIALAVAVAAFVIGVLALPMGRRKKILIAACGAPFVAVALFIYFFVFVGIAFGDWL